MFCQAKIFPMNTPSAKPRKMRRQPRQARSQERVNHILDIAEEIFITQGYNTATTNAIASQAQVSIGSLYQFFPDKAAILYALADRYNQQLRQSLKDLDSSDKGNLSLCDYVEQLIDRVEVFFAEHPGYHAIFMPLQGMIPELEAINEAADAQLIEDLTLYLPKRYSSLHSQTYEVIAFVLVKAIGTLIWLSLNQKEPFRQQLLTESKRLALSYLQSHFPT